MFDYRGNLSTKQKIASTLIATPIALGAGWLFGKFVESKAEEMADDKRLEAALLVCSDGLGHLGVEVDPTNPIEKIEMIQAGAFAVSAIGGTAIGKAVGESTKAVIYHHSTNK
jgi:hypothetical protein